MILHNSRNKEAIHAKTISFLDMLCYGYAVRTKKYDRTKHMFLLLKVEP